MPVKIEVLGTGCAKCQKLYEATKAGVAQAGVAAEVVKVEDIAKIMGYGVMVTPALVVDGVVKVTGRVPDAGEIAGLLR
jgi:small redox-active disulfide protein 2